jgi:hypothetical protein
MINYFKKPARTILCAFKPGPSMVKGLVWPLLGYWQRISIELIFPPSIFHHPFYYCEIKKRLLNSNDLGKVRQAP